MELKVSEWKEFKVNRIFLWETTMLSIKDVLDEGSVPFISRTAENNGCDGYVDVSADAITKGHCLTVGAEGIYCFYQPVDFATGNKVYTLRNTDLTMNQYLFIATILNQEDYKYNYGRARIKSKLENEILRLPIQHDVAGQPVIDPSRKYSDDGYVPDWDFMEQYMKSLNTQPLVTQRGGSASLTLGVDRWKEFLLNRICKISMGNKFDNDKMSHENPTINFVSRTAENNGIADFVDVVNGVCPYDAGSLTVALGGSIGSCFLQKKPFYTGQNVAVLEFDSVVSDMAKLFLSTLFMHECCSKFVAFGRELNTHIRTDLTLFLPVQHDAAGQPAIDPSRKYSDDGYIPDWAFMEQYIGSLPGSDLI